MIRLQQFASRISRNATLVKPSELSRAFSTLRTSILSNPQRNFPLNGQSSPIHPKVLRDFSTSSQSTSSSPTDGKPPKKGKAKKYLRNAFAAFVLLVALTWYMAMKDDTFARPLTFWKRAFPIYVRYCLVQYKHDLLDRMALTVARAPDSFSSPILGAILKFQSGQDHSSMTLAESQDVLKACRAADFDVLNERYATTVLDIITSLRGYYIKLGQLGSLRSDFLPPQWIHELEKLQDSAPYADFSVVEEILCKDLGIASASEIFQSVDPVPLGAASIGQVHRAVLRDGRVVVVKVQYPGIEKTFETDMRTIRIFCEQAQPEQLPFLTEVEKQFMTEFDFRAEAANLQEVADNMAKSPFGSVVAVPRPLPELCGRAVVTMEFLPGPKLVDALRDMCRGMAEAEGVSLQEFMQKHQEAPPSSTLVAAHRAYHLVADGALNALKAAYNGTVGWVATPLAYSWTPRLLDIRGIVHTLLNVHAHQIVVDGVFNGDPHPGNILMLPDGRIGLIDFGQVKRLGLQKRMIFCHFVKALVDDDRPRAARLYQVMGHRTKRNSDEVLFELSRLGFNYDDEESRRGLNIEKFFESLNELDPVTQPGDDWVMVSRVSLLLRGLAGALHYPVRTAEHFLPVCKTFQRQHRALDAWVDEYVAAMDAVAKDNLYGTPREAEMIRAMESRGEMLARQTK